MYFNHNVLNILAMLTASLVMFASFNLIALCRIRAGFRFLLGAGVFVLAAPFALIIYPVIFLQGLFTGLGGLIWMVKPTFWRFFALSSIATVVAYGVFIPVIFNREREDARLRGLYPYQSLETRLQGTKPTPLPESSALESDSESDPWFYGYSSLGAYRTYQLENIHERGVELFLFDGQNFGFSRMATVDDRLEPVHQPGPVPLQPAPTAIVDASPGEMKPAIWEDLKPFNRLLFESIVDFANPQWFGYFKDRQHVAGFESHQFTKVPQPENLWEVDSLQLVSLLIHPEPRVYESDRLPRMEGGRNQPTRPLDWFETAGLDALKEGLKIYLGEKDDTLRMLGAIRANFSCLKCHDAREGDLLGAFSYRLHAGTSTSQ